MWLHTGLVVAEVSDAEVFIKTQGAQCTTRNKTKGWKKKAVILLM